MMAKWVIKSPTPTSFLVNDYLDYIPYNSANKDYAKENRYPMTKAEKKMRFWILKARPWGYKFIRQKMINSFIIDFYCAKLLLGIEIDWSSHDTRQVYDKQRTEKLWKSWVKIIRYANEDVFYNIDAVFQNLTKELNTRAKELEQANPYSPRRDSSPYQGTIITKELL